MEAIINVNNYTKIIKGQTILNRVNFSLAPGNIYGFIGYNGSGKSMLMKAICGFILPTEGHVVVQGKRIGVDIDFPQSVGVIIEHPSFIPEYSAQKNLRFLAEIRNQVKTEDIIDVLKTVGLDPNSSKKVRAFSLGMTQRLAIAQAIMEDPDILILDEPMNGLDEDGVVLVRKLLLDLKANGKTILLCSHVAEDIELLCAHVWRMRCGEAHQER